MSNKIYEFMNMQRDIVKGLILQYIYDIVQESEEEQPVERSQRIDDEFIRVQEAMKHLTNKDIIELSLDDDSYIEDVADNFIRYWNDKIKPKIKDYEDDKIRKHCTGFSLDKKKKAWFSIWDRISPKIADISNNNKNKTSEYSYIG